MTGGPFIIGVAGRKRDALVQVLLRCCKAQGRTVYVSTEDAETTELRAVGYKLAVCIEGVENDMPWYERSNDSIIFLAAKGDVEDGPCIFHENNRQEWSKKISIFLALLARV